jgi:serine/tyrosine/threonine adenylyltransferase
MHRSRIFTQRNMSTLKHSISALPLPPRSQILTHNLTPDPATASVTEWRSKVQVETPSLQRRARLLDPHAHYSFVAPLPIPFPYEVRPPEGTEVQDRAAFIEKWLADREALHCKDTISADNKNKLRVFHPLDGVRDQPRELIGLSATGLNDCLPHLDVGDALDVIGSPTLTHEFEDDAKSTEAASGAAAREELVDILSGHALLVSGDGAELPYAPYA